jgi:polyhydroxyalkanoate synthase subunit PhaE
LDEDAPMADPANDFIRDYQALAQQSWDAWTRQLQQQPQAAANPFFAPPPAPASGSDTLERTLAGLKGYFDWMQAAAASGAAAPSGDWRQQLQQMFGGASQPFAQAFGGIDSAGAEGFSRQWQSWMQAAQHSGFGELPGAQGPIPTFGLSREQQMQQQDMAAAVMEAMQASSRYQALIQRASAQGVERMQDKLAQHAEPGRQIDSPKALYDLWVDASEESYAEIALTDEFRDAYGEMVNTQMRVRKLQQQQTEQMCQQLGVPTRAEVSSLGERLQALRREFRASVSIEGKDSRTDEVAELRSQLAEVKRQLHTAMGAAAPASKPAAATRKSPAKAAAVPKGKAADLAAAAASRQPAARKATRSPSSRVPSASRARPAKRKK